MIDVKDLTKHYKVHVRESGLRAALKSLVNRKFRDVRAVDGISFQIAEGEMVGFLGPNGAGKTTTMKLLTGLLHPTSGELRVGGFVPFKQSNEFKRNISLVMGQKSQLIWDLPASETFEVHRAIYEIDDRSFKKQRDGLVELLQLQAVIDKPVRQLSLGERMKCELAASLLHQPKLVFLDEPTIGLDVHMQEAVRQFIQAYNQEFKATILLTSHYMTDVSALCERVMVINRGHLLYDGKISELISRFAPNKRLTLQFAPGSAEMQADDGPWSTWGDVRVVRVEGLVVELEVSREAMSDVVQRVLSQLPIQDFTVEDPSLEDVIGQAFNVETSKREDDFHFNGHGADDGDDW